MDEHSPPDRRLMSFEQYLILAEPIRRKQLMLRGEIERKRAAGRAEDDLRQLQRREDAAQAELEELNERFLGRN